MELTGIAKAYDDFFAIEARYPTVVEFIELTKMHGNDGEMSPTLAYLRDKVIEAGNRLGMAEYRRNKSTSPDSDWGPPSISQEFARTRIIEKIVQMAEEEVGKDMNPEPAKRKGWFGFFRTSN